MSVISSDPTVLVVDDQQDVADAYVAQLETEYETRVAYGGDEALETVDGDVDVMLLDRRMPDRSGDEVLETVRERGLDCAVIMVTAVEPGFDIIEMPVDAYIYKPADRETLVNAVETQLAIHEYDDQLQEYMELTGKLELLKEKKSASALQDNEELHQLADRVDELQSSLDDVVTEFDEPSASFRDFF